MKRLRSNRAPPCRFEFFHIVELLVEEAVKKIRRRGKELVHVPHIVSTCARNQCGLCALERPQPFRSASSDCSLVTLRCNNDFGYMPRGVSLKQMLWPQLSAATLHNLQLAFTVCEKLCRHMRPCGAWRIASSPCTPLLASSTTTSRSSFILIHTYNTCYHDENKRNQI